MANFIHDTSLEVCDCHCHHGSGLKHPIPCCIKCQVCGKMIRKDVYNLHLQICREKNEELLKLSEKFQNKKPLK